MQNDINDTLPETVLISLRSRIAKQRQELIALKQQLQQAQDLAAQTAALQQQQAEQLLAERDQARAERDAARLDVQRVLNRKVVRWVDALKGVVRPSPARAEATTQRVAQSEEVSVEQQEVGLHADIVVCVHNALPDVKACLASVLRYTTLPYRLILVDDGSQEDTAAYLKAFAFEQGAHLIRHEAALGYTLAANRGMQATSGRYVVLLNSDTLVTPQWLERLVATAEVHPVVGIVGPLSNTASWQSVPEFEQDGDWATNPLPAGMSIERFSQLLALRAGRLNPHMPFLNGFCLLIKRQLIDQIGLFDEETFAKGYGEENDYCLRARAAGFVLLLADDCYVYHAQSKSYSHERRQLLAEAAGRALAAKHGQAIIDAGVQQCRHSPVLQGIRARARQLLARQTLVDEGRRRWEGKRMLFVLPVVNAGGGGNVVVSEVRALQEMGVDARIVNLAHHASSFEAAYPNLNLPVIYVEGESELAAIAGDYDAIVATAYHTAFWIHRVGLLHPKLMLGYYVQDFEPYFFEPQSAQYQRALASYQLDSRIRLLTKTRWNEAELARIGAKASRIGISYEVDLYRPANRASQRFPEGKIRIAAMVRPTSPRRSPLLTMQVLRDIKLRYSDQVEIVLFGIDRYDLAWSTYQTDFEYELLGVCDQAQLAAAFRDIDIFTDFSTFQAMGLTALEAMSSGVAVIAPEAGGASEFIRHRENALLVDTRSKAACIDAVSELITNHALRDALQRQALLDVPIYHPQGVAYRILQTLFEEESA
ncbi:glycosyltransferase [Parachitinimonas caeni]|uniref:Glycosyltransferase n=1 Tax=Parachitinimonas caeni TaxID=3031301 RepID=A0ABT7DRU4_9NEIS|nr:glycosyltransferase [Parachitinimonas caeni]MDK2122793.1 glycosyltransferase [Parachitinimonas caeni]